MKIGSNLTIFRDYGNECFKKMKEFGYDYADIHIDDAPYTSDEEAYYAYYMNQKRLADEAGVTIWQVHGPWRYPPHDETPEHRADRLRIMTWSIKATAKIGCKLWVVHPLMPFGENDDFNYEKFLDINYEHFMALLPVAKENGVTICLENMPFRFLSISKPDNTYELVKRINDENFKMCLDTGHSAVFGLSPADAVRKIGKDIKALHIHDNLGDGDIHLLPLMGVIDWKDFMKALKEIEFDGVFSLETSWNNFLPNSVCNETKLKALRGILDELMSY